MSGSDKIWTGVTVLACLYFVVKAIVVVGGFYGSALAGLIIGVYSMGRYHEDAGGQ